VARRRKAEVNVIASEAKQSRATKQRLDCFVASLLAMTSEASYPATALLSPGRLASSDCSVTSVE
jgi:hypothetical protein